MRGAIVRALGLALVVGLTPVIGAGCAASVATAPPSAMAPTTAATAAPSPSQTPTANSVGATVTVGSELTYRVDRVEAWPGGWDQKIAGFQHIAAHVTITALEPQGVVVGYRDFIVLDSQGNVISPLPTGKQPALPGETTLTLGSTVSGFVSFEVPEIPPYSLIYQPRSADHTAAGVLTAVSTVSPPTADPTPTPLPSPTPARTSAPLATPSASRAPAPGRTSSPSVSATWRLALLYVDAVKATYVNIIYTAIPLTYAYCSAEATPEARASCMNALATIEADLTRFSQHLAWMTAHPAPCLATAYRADRAMIHELQDIMLLGGLNAGIDGSKMQADLNAFSSGLNNFISGCR